MKLRLSILGRFQLLGSSVRSINRHSNDILSSVWSEQQNITRLEERSLLNYASAEAVLVKTSPVRCLIESKGKRRGKEEGRKPSVIGGIRIPRMELMVARDVPTHQMKIARD